MHWSFIVYIMNCICTHYYCTILNNPQTALFLQTLPTVMQTRVISVCFLLWRTLKCPNTWFQFKVTPINSGLNVCRQSRMVLNRISDVNDPAYLPFLLQIVSRDAGVFLWNILRHILLCPALWTIEAYVSQAWIMARLARSLTRSFKPAGVCVDLGICALKDLNFWFSSSLALGPDMTGSWCCCVIALSCFAGW